jgi:3'-phosphoadenosine 5'-phosphosulfate sulfotransferase (PAPS reductase)/FAD synthetase
MKHIVALSGGKDSTAMALRLVEVEPRDYEFVCTPTGNELPDMVQHWVRLGRLLGKPLRPLVTGVSLGSLIRWWNALPNWRQRWCTRVLKIEPFQQYVAANSPATIYVGIRADEQDREGVEYENRRFPLVEWGWDKAKVLSYLAERGVEIPKRTDCAACFFQTLGEWWALWHDHPADYLEAEAWEAQTGHTFRSPQRDTHPVALKDLRAEFEAGYVPKARATMDDRPRMCGTCAR